MSVLFLDVDGVLNRHQRHENGFCGMDGGCVRQLNRVLGACPEVEIVVSSAWRYIVHNGGSTLVGLEHLLLTHGVDCKGRVAGVTSPDTETFDPQHHEPPFDQAYWSERGLAWRKNQILEYVARNNIEAFAVVDDLALDMPELVLTDGRDGLTASKADEIICRLWGLGC